MPDGRSKSSVTGEIPLRSAVNFTTQEQAETFANAERAVREDVDKDLTVGEVVQELAEAYTGWSA